MLLKNQTDFRSHTVWTCRTRVLFHNGADADLNELVDFYNERFQMNLTQQRQLAAILDSL